MMVRWLLHAGVAGGNDAELARLFDAGKQEMD